MTIPVIQPKRRRSALETFDGCPYRFDVLYNLCICSHRHADHDPVTGECCGQVKPQRRRAGALNVVQPLTLDEAAVVAKKVPCECEQFRPVEDRGDESQRGIAFHEIAFRYIDRLARAKTPADAEEAALAYQEGIALSQVAPHLLPDVKKLWGRFSEWFQLDLKAYLSAEERQESERFTWIPDLVYVYPRNITIYDWKTYYKGLTEAQALREFQLQFYMLQAMEIWPNFDTYTFVFNFVRLGYQVSITLRPHQIEDFRPNVEAIMLAMNEAERTNNYPAIAGSHCQLCRLKCPLADNPMRLPVRFTTKSEAEHAFARVLTLEQELKALRKSLKGWCNQEGPLFYRGQEYRFDQYASRRYPVAPVIDFLRARGTPEDLIALITVSRSGLLDFAHPKKAPIPVLEMLADVEQATTRWSFRHRKAGEQAPAGLVDVLAGDDDDAEDED